MIPEKEREILEAQERNKENDENEDNDENKKNNEKKESSTRMFQIRTSEKNINYLEMLRDYDFVSELRANPRNGKYFIVYICKHEG